MNSKINKQSIKDYNAYTRNLKFEKAAMRAKDPKNVTAWKDIMENIKFKPIKVDSPLTN